MGHTGHLKEEHRDLVERLNGAPVGFPEPRDPQAWEGWKEILEILYTEEDARLAAQMPTHPASLEVLARRLKMSSEDLCPRLESMCDKGLVMDLVHKETGRTKYILSPPVIGFFEFSMMRAHDSIPKKRMAEALEAYTQGDEAFVNDVFGGDTVIGRALVHETAPCDDPLPDVLGWERASAVVADAREWAVSLCYCRHKAAHLGKDCDAPKEICLSLNAGAELVIRRGFGRKAEKTEALEILHQARDTGLVQIADNVLDRPTYICNCCGCCCGQLQGINDFGLRSVNPSGFAPNHHPEACNGCSRCARACPITAITMKAERKKATRKSDLVPRIDFDRCIGCGVCADACTKDALSMRRSDQSPYVPLNSIERVVRMAIERGRLADLLFDAGAGLRSRFLRNACRVLMSLPPGQRLLASEQARSRFVRAALARIKDPTG